MRTILAIVLMAGAACAFAGTKSVMIYDCGVAAAYEQCADQLEQALNKGHCNEKDYHTNGSGL